MQQLSDRNERSARSELSQSGQQPPNHSTEDGIGMRLVFLERCNKQLVSMGPCRRLRHGICSADDIFLVLFYVLYRPSGSLFFLLAFHLSFYDLVFIISLSTSSSLDAKANYWWLFSSYYYRQFWFIFIGMLHLCAYPSTSKSINPAVSLSSSIPFVCSTPFIEFISLRGRPYVANEIVTSKFIHYSIPYTTGNNLYADE